MEIIRYEKDMYEPLREHFASRGFSVYAEARGCDLAARKDGMLIVVEMKRHLSFDLLEQALDRQSFADAVYVAIPKPAVFRAGKDFRSKIRVLSRLGLGLLMVYRINDSTFVEEALEPIPGSAPRFSRRKRIAVDKELSGRRMDLNTGGTRGVPLMTAYREVSLYLAFLLSTGEAMTPKQLREQGGDSKKTGPSLRSNYYGWFERTEDKKYSLSESGYQALSVYAPMVEAFRIGADSVSPENERM